MLLRLASAPANRSRSSGAARGRTTRMIFKRSRYEREGVYQVTGLSGQPVSALKIRLIPPTPAGFLHTFTADERLDLLAAHFYQNPEKFWLIADANTELDPEELLEPGRQLRIPPDRI